MSLSDRQAKVVMLAFVGLVFVMFALALYGYMVGAWTPQ